MLGENTALSERSVDTALTVLRDRFVLEERLEQGRLGTMYRAFDRARGQDGRPYVAILILPREIARDARQTTTFERELAAVRALSHPNIVQIFALEHDGDTSFLVLEWVDGESLRSVIDGLAPETVCEADALGVVRAVGNALVYAHAKGVVHGDIRPENVLVTERGDVRLLFTSACLAGTAPFSVGPRDDIRGVAALAYELMSGHPPPVPTLYPRGKADEPAPIDGLSRKRWKALKSALAPRGGRIGSVRQLLAALQLPQPRTPRPGSRPDRIRPGPRSAFKWLVTATLVAGLVALVVGAVSLFIRDGAPSADVAGWTSDVGAGAERAAEASRDGLARAGAAVTAVWRDLGRRVEEASAERAMPVASDAAGPADQASSPAATAAVPSERSAAAQDTNAAPDGAAADGGPQFAEAAGNAARTAETGDGDRADGPPNADATLSAAGAESASRAAEPAVAAAAVERASPRTAETEEAPPIARPVPRVVFARDEYVVSESAGAAAIEVRRQDGIEGAVSFVWWTRDGSARAGDDYADLGRVVEELPAGQASATLYVPITSDSIVEDPREHFEIHLGVLSGDGNQSGALESATVSIVDDDR